MLREASDLLEHTDETMAVVYWKYYTDSHGYSSLAVHENIPHETTNRLDPTVSSCARMTHSVGPAGMDLGSAHRTVHPGTDGSGIKEAQGKCPQHPLLLLL